MPAVIIVLLCIPLVTTTLALGLPFFTVLAWKHHYWSPFARLHYTLVTGGALVFIWVLHSWNLLGFRF